MKNHEVSLIFQRFLRYHLLRIPKSFQLATKQFLCSEEQKIIFQSYISEFLPFGYKGYPMDVTSNIQHPTSKCNRWLQKNRTKNVTQLHLERLFFWKPRPFNCGGKSHAPLVPAVGCGHWTASLANLARRLAIYLLQILRDIYHQNQLVQLMVQKSKNHLGCTKHYDNLWVLKTFSISIGNRRISSQLVWCRHLHKDEYLHAAEVTGFTLWRWDPKH